MALANNEHKKKAIKAFKSGVSFHELHKSKALPVGRTTLYYWWKDWRASLSENAPKAPRRSSAALPREGQPAAA